MTGDTPLEDAVRERTAELRGRILALREDLADANAEIEALEERLAALSAIKGDNNEV